MLTDLVFPTRVLPLTLVGRCRVFLADSTNRHRAVGERVESNESVHENKRVSDESEQSHDSTERRPF